MSRIGKKPIGIPDKVEVSIKGLTVDVKGPKGQLTYTFNSEVKIEKVENALFGRGWRQVLDDETLALSGIGRLKQGAGCRAGTRLCHQRLPLCFCQPEIAKCRKMDFSF